MNAVVHGVGFESSADFLVGSESCDGISMMPVRLASCAVKSRCARSAGGFFHRPKRAITFPDGVAALDGGVEGADGGFVAVDQLAVDVHQEIAVAFVELLSMSVLIKDNATSNAQLSTSNIEQNAASPVQS